MDPLKQPQRLACAGPEARTGSAGNTKAAVGGVWRSDYRRHRPGGGHKNKTMELVKAYEMGMENDISKVMINQQVSSLGFQMTLNVRNKVLSAYKDIMNMPV